MAGTRDASGLLMRICRLPAARALVALAAAILAALVLAPAALAIPTNDSFAAPFNVDLAAGEVTVDTTGAAEELNEPLTPSGPGVCNPGARNMVATTWYRLLGNGGTITIDTAGSNFNTVIGVYVKSPPALVDGSPCNDDVAIGNVTSALSFDSVAGGAYLIQVGGCNLCGTVPPANFVTGTLRMHVSATAPPPPPPVVITPPDTDADGIPDAKDACPTVKPTRDANNDGCQDKPIRILSDLKYDGRFIRRGGAVRGIALSRVRLTRVPTGAVVRVTCAGCRRAAGRGGTRAFRSFSFTAQKGGTQTMGRLNRILLLRGRQIVVVVTDPPDHLGRKVVVRMAGSRDRVTLSCLAVGSLTKRVACSTGS